MKFGKRLLAEASRKWADQYVDYKAVKKAIKDDVAAQDASGSRFHAALVSELTKVSAFHARTAGQLEDRLAAIAIAASELASAAASEASSSATPPGGPASPLLLQLSHLRSEVKDLTKFVALNYLAVVKSIKKRNRHLRETFGAAASNSALHALDLLGHEAFFTSPRLAQLSTHAEVLAAELAAAQAQQQAGGSAAEGGAEGGTTPSGRAASEALLRDYECPVCLETLAQPVVLTCAHRFCWGCLVAHCTTARDSRLPQFRQEAKDQMEAQGTAASLAAAAAASAVQSSTSSPASGRAATATGGGESPGGGDAATATTTGAASAAESTLTGAAAALQRQQEQQQQGEGAGSRTDVRGPLDQRTAAAQPQQPQPPRFLGLVDGDDVLAESARFFSCPVCRKPQILDIDSLEVDSFLAAFVDGLQQTGSSVHLQTNTSGGGGTTAAAAVDVKGKAALASAAAAVAASGRATPPPLLLPTAATALTAAAAAAAAALPASSIIPPQTPQHAGRLTVLLDLDGTLVASYTPKRAPRLPPGVRTHLVGRGSKLNPQGVYVVERPGLQQFLSRLAAWAEVIVFTAGLEDYAAPIIAAIDPGRQYFAHVIYREGTVRTEHYQCVKDMSRLGRRLGRCVLVDDTPLAFLHQPDNGIPVLGFRGDPDDRLLLEAVTPLLQSLNEEADVRSLLRKRFDMAVWFRRNGFPLDAILDQAAAQAAAASAAVTAAATATSAARLQQQQQQRQPGIAVASSVAVAAANYTSAASAVAAYVASSVVVPATPMAQPPATPKSSPLAIPPPSSGERLSPPRPPRDVLLLCDFDRTVTDWDAGERLVEALAPELLAALVGHPPGANYLPATNGVLAEMARRGVTKDVLVSALRQLGSEVPAASLQMLQLAAACRGVDTAVLSDCNAVFITHILHGAGAGGLVGNLITNSASFERVAAMAAAAAAADFCGGDSSDASAALSSSPSNSAGGSGGGGGGSSTPLLYGSSFGSSCSSALSGASPPLGPQSPLLLLGTPLSGGAEHKLVISPCHVGASAHGCPRCPPNLCKGLELRRLRSRQPYGRVVYCGDGFNDICAALQLQAGDVLLARKGHALAEYVAMTSSASSAAKPAADMPRVAAAVRLWADHDELLALVRELLPQEPGDPADGGSAR